MKLLDCRTFDRETLLSRLKETRLRGYGSPKIYEHADLSVSSRDPNELAPAQAYVLKDGVDRALDLRRLLLKEGVDIFALNGGAYIRTDESPDEEIPILPPIIEESAEPGGETVPLINDGIHRIFAARLERVRISVVFATNVPKQYPYYAFPLEGGWNKVVELNELPDNFEKKRYRQPDNYKSLFRNFNEVFPGVQKERKSSNPAHLRA